MYWLIENEDQLKVLSNSGYKDFFIHIIPFNNNTHPIENGVSLVYLRPLAATKGYMLCIKHNESFSLSINDVYTTLQKFETLFTVNKKLSLHSLPLKSLIDICYPPNPYILPSNKAYDFFYSKYKEHKELNTIIPIVKHYEYCEEIFEANVDKCKVPTTKYEKFFNKISITFASLERKGLKIDKDIFEEHFHCIFKEYTYTQFNLKTTTTRPSNSFKGVNYVALNKTNGCRKAFIARNDYLIDIDISAYHPSLTALLIGYKFPTPDVHQYFAELYGVSYEESKKITFQQSYGGVFKQYKHLEYFKKLEKYIEDVWENYQKTGEHECLISGFKFKKENLEDMNPQKLYNYILQNLETSMNALIIKDILKLTQKTDTQLIHYCYDSFLLDFSDKERHLAEPIREIFKKYKLNIKTKQGNDYSFTEGD